MALEAPILSHFGIPKQSKAIKKALENQEVKIQVSGLIGSSFAITASGVVVESSTPHLFILSNKEEASYFTNDIERLLKHEVFFFPASYRRAYQIEETDNANILLRIETLNKINRQKQSVIIISDFLNVIKT